MNDDPKRYGPEWWTVYAQAVGAMFAQRGWDSDRQAEYAARARVVADGAIDGYLATRPGLISMGRDERSPCACGKPLPADFDDRHWLAVYGEPNRGPFCSQACAIAADS